MIDGVHVRIDHSCSLRVGAPDDDQRGVQNVRLEAAGDQPLAMLRGGNQDLATHVAALLGAGLLVLDMDTSCAILDEHLSELHGCCQSSMARVGICDNGVEIVNGRGGCALVGRHAATCLKLLTVMETLSPEELVNFVWHSVVGIVGNIWP